MKDFLDNELNIGDEVAFIDKYYKQLQRGKILRFTNEQVVISYYTSLEARKYPRTIIKI